MSSLTISFSNGSLVVRHNGVLMGRIMKEDKEFIFVPRRPDRDEAPLPSLTLEECGAIKAAVEHLNAETHAATKILPCPFCGNHKPAVDIDYNRYLQEGERVFHVQCEECGAFGPGDQYGDLAVKAWNKLSGTAARQQAEAGRS